ncbi:MAG: DMT family transporter [Bacillota bacterium]
MANILCMALTVLLGLTAVLQGAFNATLLRVSSLPFVLMVTNGTAFLLSSLIFLFWTIRIGPDARLSGPVPWYAWLGGVVGVYIIAAVAYLIPRFGFTWTFSVVIAVQLIASILSDYFGLWQKPPVPVSSYRIIATLLIIAAAWLVGKK